MWRSLFLPIGETDEAVFAQSLDCPAQCFPGCADAVLAVMRSSRVLVFAMDREEGPQLYHVISPSAALTEGGATATCAGLFEGVEVFDFGQPQKTVPAVSQRSGSRTEEGLSSPPSARQASSRGEALPAEGEGSVEERHVTSGEVAMVPLQPTDTTRKSAVFARRNTHLRGAVGSSSGRVDLFDESAYLYGFDTRLGALAAVAHVLGDDCQEKDRHILTLSVSGKLVAWKKNDGSEGFSKYVLYVASGCVRHLPPFALAENYLVVYGEDGNVIRCVTPTGKTAERDVTLPGAFTRTTAIGVDGASCLVARNEVIYAICFTTKYVRRIIGASAAVCNIAVHEPLAVAVCENGELLCFGSDDGKLLGRTFTYTRKPPRSMSVDWFRLLVVVVDVTGNVEVFDAPKEFLRHGPPRPLHFAQAVVLQRLVTLEEEARTRSAANEEACILARYNVPEEAASYCGKRTFVP